VTGATSQLTALFGVVDAGDPLSVSVGLIGVATLLPATLLGYLIVGLRPLTVLRSVQFRIRWKWLGWCLLPALAITAAATLVELLIFPVFFGGAIVPPTIPLGTFLICTAIILVVTPIQAAAEEFAFRGLVTQLFGSWIRPVWLVIPLAAIPFAAAHTQYLGWATADVAFFALTASFVTWRTGGIEAGIALHAVNNTVAFLILATSLGGTTSTSSTSTGDPWSLSVTIVTFVAYAWWVDRAARKRSIQNRLVPVAADAAGIADTSSG
jgi:membrane protease YdiL (CAAX protease family)